MENRKKQFIYILKLIPSLLVESNWTNKEEAIVERHFANLKRLLDDGKLVLAGKTDGLDEKTFGKVIFEADSEEEAQSVLLSDPAVAEGIMEGELFPYRVAIMRESA